MCDLLNNVNSLTGAKTESREHSMFKIDDTPTVQWDIDINEWNNNFTKYQYSNTWYGTHAHPTAIPNLQQIGNIIAITTMTRSSKLYRWLRYYNVWFKNEHADWRENDKLETIDKVRELAKNVFEEFTPVGGCINIEFEDIVNGNYVKEQNLNLEYFSAWKQNNPWLDETDSWAIKRFDEAEFEILNNVPYKYI